MYLRDDSTTPGTESFMRRKLESEGRAPSRGAFHFDGPAVLTYQRPGDGKAQPDPTRRSTRFLVHLVETFEQSIESLGGKQRVLEAYLERCERRR